MPERFTFPFNYIPHPLCIVAAEQLQQHLMHQTEWKHNFGLTDEETEGVVAGKMFGVLLVQSEENEIGYLAAFSGKLAGVNQHSMFVPPVYDLLAENSFLSKGMAVLSEMTSEIKSLDGSTVKADRLKAEDLKLVRKNYSIALQKKIFEHYHFLNQAGEEKSLNELFKHINNGTPPSGAGECAAPKLLQYAFLHRMKPLALAEFWWGLSPKSETWKHGHYYPCCHEKCEPILAHMLKGMTIDEAHV